MSDGGPIPEPYVLPCGCVVSTRILESGERAMVYAPCRPTCEWVDMVRSISDDKGNEWRTATEVR